MEKVAQERCICPATAARKAVEKRAICEKFICSQNQENHPHLDVMHKCMV